MKPLSEQQAEKTLAELNRKSNWLNQSYIELCQGLIDRDGKRREAILTALIAMRKGCLPCRQHQKDSGIVPECEASEKDQVVCQLFPLLQHMHLIEAVIKS